MMNSRERLEAFARDIRRHAIETVSRAGTSHIGGVLSMADILAALYEPREGCLRVDPDRPAWDERDRFVLSKGHCCVGVYVTLALRGFHPLDELADYAKDGSRLMSHISHKVPGVEFSTGSLGHGVSFGCGLALGAKRRGRNWRTVVVVSDGELNEGSTWEAFLFAGHHRLNNLCVVVDYNKIQSLGRVDEVLRLEPLDEKLASFGWRARRVDGHDVIALRDVLRWDRTASGEEPTIVVADTVKGFGVDFMEDALAWHYRSPSEEQAADAIGQLKAA